MHVQQKINAVGKTSYPRLTDGVFHRPHFEMNVREVSKNTKRKRFT